MEGAWLTKHAGTYYMQYAAPGTEWPTYGDGVYTAKSPLGPYTYASNSPMSYKPGGFINGAGHGSTVEGPGGQFWHFATMSISVNFKYERRIGMFPTFFDKDGVMYADTSFGDYPHFAPSLAEKKGAFTGWMLLSYKKPVTASSVGEFSPQNVTDENVKTYWVAKDNGPGQWLQIDLQTVGTIRAFQINYADYKSNLYGRVPGLYEQYVVESSRDGNMWTMLKDRRKMSSIRRTIMKSCPRRSRAATFASAVCMCRHGILRSRSSASLATWLEPAAEVKDVRVYRGRTGAMQR